MLVSTRFGVKVRLVGIAVLVACVTGIASPAQAQTGVDRLNEELQNVWTRLLPAFRGRIENEAQTQLVGLRHRTGPFRITVKRIRRLNVGTDVAPGLTQLTPDRIGLRIPRAGNWRIDVEAEVEVRFRAWFVRHTFDINVRLKVKSIRASATAEFDQTDPTRPVVRRVDQPNAHFRVEVRSRQWGYDVLFRLLSPIGNRLANKALGDVLGDLGPTLTSLQGLPGPIPGDGAPLYTDSGTATPFAEVVANVDRKQRSLHLPHGTLLRANMDVDQHDNTWLEAYRNGGTGNAGQVVDYSGGGDSAIFTGHYLAAQSYRYSVTGEADALDNVKHALWGIENLLDIHGGTGLLSRVTAPANSVVGQYIIHDNHPVYRRQMHGEEWVARNDQGSGGKGITRDQYSGVFFGLAVAHDFVNDPQVKARATLRLTQMLDYLIAHDWYIDEDRVPWTAVDRKGFPTFWLGIAYQKLAFLHIGMRVAPGRYDAEFQHWAPLTQIAWLGMWGSTFNVEHMYKFNLMFIGLYNYFRLETDPTRWQEMTRGFNLASRYIGHHHNAHLDLIRTSIDPSLSATVHPATRETLRRFLQRNHRTMGPAVVDLSGVTWVTLTMPTVDLAVLSSLGGSSSSGPPGTHQVTMPSEPLDPALRKPTGFFLWQKNPFAPATAGHGKPKEEGTGIDLTLPYWHGRVQGAF